MNYGNYTLTVGDGDATITQPDGTTSIVPSGTVLDGEGNVADNTETVTTQIGELSITTPKGQEPIQNDDGTITLPGGGTYINLSGDKVTASSSTIIRKNGDFTISDEINTDVTIIVESPDGTITTVTQGIMRTNKGLNNIPSESVNNSSDKNSEQDISWPWTTESASDNTKIYEFTDGTKITSFSMATEIYNPGYNTNYQTLPGNYINRSEYTVRYDSKCTIEFTNGVTVNAPINTSANITEGKLTITIGDGDATITQPDGTTSTVPSGTVLDE
ncbi:MAG: hypothetical protein FWD71_08540 [Oscillospiraceae bacterium]|nr:hypothetical protein [Oscillospiraceae bacterium]